jgi:polar amino acid transport system substrate-binding protein
MVFMADGIVRWLRRMGGAVGLAALLLAVPADAGAAERLLLSTGMIEPWTNSVGSGFHQALVKELFHRMRMDAEVDVNTASQRAFSLANDGVTDGLAGRVEGVEKTYPNLIRVPERMFVNDFVACSRNADLPTDWSGLVPHSVAYIIGWQVFERRLPQVRDLTLVKDSAQLLNLIKAERVEIILHERWQALWQARELGIALHCQKTPLARTDMFIYLHQRHAGLVDRVAQTLRQMKADGSYDAIARRVFSGLGDPSTVVR